MRKLLKSLALACLLCFLTSNVHSENYDIADVIDVYDGDTFTLLIEFVPFDIMVRAKIRLDGVNCPEIRTKDEKEKALGYKAKAHTEEFFKQDGLTVDIKGKEKFGRYLSQVYNDKTSLTQSLIDSGLGKEYHGEKRPKDWFK